MHRMGCLIFSVDSLFLGTDGSKSIVFNEVSFLGRGACCFSKQMNELGVVRF